MNLTSHFVRFTAACLLLTLAACGGGGDDGAGAGAPPAGTVVGAAGGTVVGPSGAKVEIPPGALAADTVIKIEESSTGAPDLPTGFSARGPMVAFTPHGTTFAVPVTVTLPFDATTVPVGLAPAFYKTNAQNQWERVHTARFTTDSVSATITRFSNGQSGVELRQCPKRVWSIFPTTKEPFFWGATTRPGTDDEQTCGEVLVPFLFGAANPTFEQDNGATPGLAMGEVYSSPTGETFSAYAEAPLGDPNLPEFRSGGIATLGQSQSYVKRSPNATLELVLSAGFLAAADFNGRPLPSECAGFPLDRLSDEEIFKFCPPIWTHVEFKLVAYKGSPLGGKAEFFATHAQADMMGFHGKWKFYAHTLADSLSPLWTTANFSVSGLDGSTPLASLNAPLVVSIDLSSIEVCPPDMAAIFCEAFTVFAVIRAEAWNWRGRESGAAAFLLDPQNIGGTALRMTNLEATNQPAPLPADSVAPVACASGPDPAAGVLQFNGGPFSVPEGSGTRGTRDTILVTRIQGSKGAVSVNLGAGGGTAVSGVDYEMPSVTVRFADGDTTPRLVTINVLSNTSIEADKTLNLTLTDPGGCASLGQQASAVLTILDDDRPPPPPPSVTIGGTVTGLAGSELVLRHVSTGENLATGNGPFTFSQLLPSGFGYSVAVGTQPGNPSQICTVTNGSGVANANITNVAVNCITPAANGSLDPGFGDAGKVSSAFGGDESGMALQADGKIVMVSGGSDFTVARYHADGSLDAGFGSAGTVSTDIAAGQDEAHGVAIQSDGKIVVVGQAVVGRTANNQFNFDFALTRYNADGSLDTSFGSGGKVTTDFNGQADRARAVAIQTDGKIVVVGSATPATGISTDFAVARFNSNGTPDTSFGSGGKVTTDVGGAHDIAQNVVLQPNGAILVSGVLTLGSDSTLGHAGLARYSANGSLDGSFGSGGKLTLPNLALGEALALQGDGRILVAGNAPVGASSGFALMRLEANGGVDAGFGIAGLVTAAFSTRNDCGRAVAVQADGRIVVAGQSSIGSNPDFAVARFAANGTLDPSFGTGGKLTIDFFGSFDGAENVAMQPDGKIVLGGFARNGTRTGYGLARVNP